MNKPFSRRTLLVQGGITGLFVAGTLLSGCKRQGKTIEIDFPGDDYSSKDAKRFHEALEAGHTVRVKFDGTKKLSKNSKLFKDLFGEKENPKYHVQNYKEFAQQLHDMDTKEGRIALSKIFDDSLLDHQESSARHTLPSGEIIEPGTVMLVAVGIFLAMSLVALGAGLTQPGPKRIKLKLGSASIEVSPVAP